MIYMFKIAVVGDKDSILAFKALGVDVFSVYDSEEARKTVDTIARNNYGIIFITEQIANLIPDTIERYDKEIIPAVILIPSNQGTLNIGMSRINKNVEKAVGSNIL
ncbi:V/A-type H+-transporting ATPase subunit F [Lutispora thermophila DSM 19022]|uniref:V-type ATP synthase subunit F n=2 Tax=Lutispora TaxID=667112 RepID=A0A1M6CM97_9FIRM|nr:V/A-type H+-transporting ATPase subunit F [Lutispora thermophila DSM 19022]